MVEEGWIGTRGEVRMFSGQCISSIYAVSMAKPDDAMRYMSRVRSIAGFPQCYASIVQQWLVVGAAPTGRCTWNTSPNLQQVRPHELELCGKPPGCLTCSQPTRSGTTSKPPRHGVIKVSTMKVKHPKSICR